MLNDYSINQNSITIFCDITCAINVSMNPDQHSRIKHIDIQHHFVMDLVEGNIIVLKHIHSKGQLTDLFTKL